MRCLSHPERVLTLVLLSLLLACSAPDSDSSQPVLPLNEADLPTQTVSAPAPAIPAATRASLTLITPTASTDQIPSLLPTPTPFTYAVKSGDTISQIAQRYGLTVDEVVAANPGINTQILSIGQVIQIPSRPAALANALPAPANLTIGPLHCFPSGQGMWCISLLQNPQAEPIENITGQITLFDQNAEPLGSLDALIPLNILPARAALPIAAFFPSRPPEPFAAQLDIATAFLLVSGDVRYLPARVDNLLTQISADGLSAQVSGRIFLPESNLPATEIWLAGIAYNENGQVIGFRRWQSSIVLEPGQSQTFAFAVYSLDGFIDRLEVIAEARP
ncbi:MAG: hypothetical protein CVU44_05875 [Chloroflexi bacterium HGW-Chloroflexi-6]|nr:MAG: hypothetical protein CVU44_05875 [Chloroflexi bacterium HGW-Chloroflexi-6]